ncbi:uncharacterized protein LOC118187123 [Stegodyphus dumicola]|uniref:uncharacterized protein LOC118187123 n=1 Tax=Stegodyphus dumicola TaxID=202533 RepID=UPI0015B09A21|nr:uncharacterized protein LOC118187123 [Stegodyphus dumicola]
MLSEQRIQIVQGLRYLGLIFDEKMTWIPHVIDLKPRTSVIARGLKKLQGHKWGLNPHIQKILFKTVVEKIITYAAAVWAFSMQGCKIRHLSAIQRPFALDITRAYRTTASNAINVLAGLLPLHLRVQKEAVRQLIKQLRRPASFSDEYFLPEEYEIPAPDFRTHPPFKGIGVWIQVQPNTTALPSQIEIYTDGSKINENTGSAFAVLRHHIITHHWKGQLRSQNSIFQDNLSSLHALGNPDHPSPIIQNIQQNLREHFLHQLKLEWIKPHAGHYGNETTDSLAKEAASCNADTLVNIPWPISYLKKCLRLKAIGRWQEEWDQGSNGRRAQYHIAYVDTDRIISNPQLVRFITGHGPFRQYFAKTEAEFHSNRTQSAAEILDPQSIT